ncbi:MAG: hypothetical protein ACI83I_001555 [Bacteroidia bacterium]|jgi:hypothetical protein
MKTIYILLSLFVSTADAQTVNLFDSLEVCMPFDGNAMDESGNGHNGTVTGATLTTDRNGNANSAYSFSGLDVITASPIGLPSGNSARSVSLWIRLETSVDSDVPLCWGKPSTGQAYGIALGTNVGVSPQGFRHFGFGSDIKFVYDYPDTGWFNITTTYDGSEGKLYVNGALAGTGTKTWNTALDTFLIGRNVNFNINDDFIGDIDDIRIYSRVLNSDEIAALQTFSSACTSVGIKNHLEQGPEVSMYPNPTSRLVHLSTQIEVEGITVVNAMGQIIAAPISLHDSTKTVDLSNQPAGVYFLHIASANGLIVKKVVRR